MFAIQQYPIESHGAGHFDERGSVEHDREAEHRLTGGNFFF